MIQPHAHCCWHLRSDEVGSAFTSSGVLASGILLPISSPNVSVDLWKFNILGMRPLFQVC